MEAGSEKEIEETEETEIGRGTGATEGIEGTETGGIGIGIGDVDQDQGPHQDVSLNIFSLVLFCSTFIFMHLPFTHHYFLTYLIRLVQ